MKSFIIGKLKFAVYSRLIGVIDHEYLEKNLFRSKDSEATTRMKLLNYCAELVIQGRLTEAAIFCEKELGVYSPYFSQWIKKVKQLALIEDGVTVLKEHSNHVVM